MSIQGKICLFPILGPSEKEVGVEENYIFLGVPEVLTPGLMALTLVSGPLF